jgi:hypothetical protein
MAPVVPSCSGASSKAQAMVAPTPVESLGIPSPLRCSETALAHPRADRTGNSLGPSRSVTTALSKSSIALTALDEAFAAQVAAGAEERQQ